MAQPSADIASQTWLHGTFKQEYAKGIWENGLQPNLLSNSPYKGEIWQTMDDHVYLTTNSRTAITSCRSRNDVDDPTQLPFILEFDGQDLINIFPDEDEFGTYMMGYFRNPDFHSDREWLEKHRSVLEVNPKTWLEDSGLDAEWEYLYDTLLEGLSKGWFDYKVACGKMIIPKLTSEEVYSVLTDLPEGSHNLAHKGILHPTNCYRLTENPDNFLYQTWEYVKENSVLVASGDSSFEAVTFINDEDFPSDENMDDIDAIDETSYYYYIEKNGIKHFNNINITDLSRFYDMIQHKPYTVKSFTLSDDHNITSLIGMPIEANYIKVNYCAHVTSLEGLTPIIHNRLYLRDIPSLTSLEHLVVPDSKKVTLYIPQMSDEEMQTWADINNCSINAGRIRIHPKDSSDE